MSQKKRSQTLADRMSGGPVAKTARTPEPPPMNAYRLRMHNEAAYRRWGWIKRGNRWYPPPPRSLTGPSTKRYT